MIRFTSPESLFGFAVAAICVVAFLVILYRAEGESEVPDKIEPDANGQCQRCGRPIANDS